VNFSEADDEAERKKALKVDQCGVKAISRNER
jgi:hypothetical protein